jgi:hypothetical protein
MSKNKSSKRGPISQLVIGGAILVAATTASILSPVAHILPSLWVWSGSAAVALVGIGFSLAGGIRLHNMQKATKIAQQTNQKSNVKSKELAEELEQGLQKNKVLEKEAVNEIPLKKSNKISLENFQTTNGIEKNTFVIYESDGMTVKQINGHDMIYKITSDEHYKQYLRDYLVSKASGDCVVEVFGPNAKVNNQNKLEGESFILIGNKYKNEYGKLVNYIDNISRYLKANEFTAELN